MDSNAIGKIENLALQAADVKNIEGKPYAYSGLKRVYSDPRPKAINISSLKGIKDYLETNVDRYDIRKLIAIIDSYSQIDLVTNIRGESNQRHSIIISSLESINGFAFGQYMSQERFIIALRAKFEKTDDQKSILRYTAKIDTESNVRTEDDGVTQNINVKQGLTGVKTEREKIPSICKLKPFRTFSEIEQPESEFLFRMKTVDGRAECALFEADGGAWKQRAKDAIAKYLRESVPEITVLS